MKRFRSIGSSLCTIHPAPEKFLPFLSTGEITSVIMSMRGHPFLRLQPGYSNTFAGAPCARRGARPEGGICRAGRWLLLLSMVVATGTGCQHAPPRETGTFRASDLVELTQLEPTLKLDIRYAGTNNFMHRAMYREARAFLQRPAAEALVRAHRGLAGHGFGLMIFDGYRPWSVTKMFWDAATPEARRIEFVANPRKGSRHNRGCAVDLTLYDLKTGKEVSMPSAYDEFSERAYPDYAGGTQEAREHRDLLRRSMEAQGFVVYKAEWWHFDYKDWTQYRIQNLPFDRIAQ